MNNTETITTHASTGISEFERLKPTETMAAINNLIREMRGIVDDNGSSNPQYVIDKLIDIRTLLKNGD